MSGLLAVWLSGFVFLFCCGTMPFAKAAETDFCPLSKMSGHCDKSSEPQNSPTFSESNAQFDCCEFLPKVYDRFRNIEKAQTVAQPADKPKFERPRFAPATNGFETAQKFHQNISIPEKVFIRNCVFRI